MSNDGEHLDDATVSRLRAELGNDRIDVLCPLCGQHVPLGQWAKHVEDETALTVEAVEAWFRARWVR